MGGFLPVFGKNGNIGLRKIKFMRLVDTNPSKLLVLTALRFPIDDSASPGNKTKRPIRVTVFDRSEALDNLNLNLKLFTKFPAEGADFILTRLNLATRKFPLQRQMTSYSPSGNKKPPLALYDSANHIADKQRKKIYN
jgi:hypothetical protein